MEAAQHFINECASCSMWHWRLSTDDWVVLVNAGNGAYLEDSEESDPEIVVMRNPPHVQREIEQRRNTAAASFTGAEGALFDVMEAIAQTYTSPATRPGWTNRLMEQQTNALGQRDNYTPFTGHGHRIG